MNKNQLTLAMIAAQFAVSSTTLVQAQVLEEVIVTARKINENLMEVPVAVSVVNGATMDREGITNLEQISARIPTLQLGRSALASSIYIRGIGSGINLGFEQSVGMYTDGIYQVRSRQFTKSMVDLERIEVLRGPQSLLFGKNTVAGAIKVETANPALGQDFNGYLTLDLEPEYSTARGTAVISGDLSDNFAARLAMRYQQTDGYVDNKYINEDVQQRDDTLGRLSLVWAPTDSLRMIGKISHTKMDDTVGIEQVNPVANSDLLEATLAGETQLLPTNVVGSIAAFAVPGFTAASGSREYDSWTGNLDWAPYDEEDLESTQVTLRADWDLDKYTITSITGYNTFEFTQKHDVDFHPGNVVGGKNDEDLDLWSQELRIASHFDGRFNFTAGIYYEEQELDVNANPTIDGTLGGVFGQLSANSLSPILPDVPLSALGINSVWNGLILATLDPAAAPLIGAEQDIIYRATKNQNDNDTAAIFVELTYDLTDTLTLDLGARYSEDTKKTKKQADLGVGAPGDQIVVVEASGMPTGVLDPQNTALVLGSWSLLATYPHQQSLNRDEDHLDPLVRLRWQVTDDIMSYLSYTEGYKSGGFNASGDTANPDGTPGPGTEFEDEEATAWELGVKANFWDNRARLSATAFYTEIDNLQVTSFRGTTFIVSNAAKLISQGLEMEGQVAVTENWEVGGAMAYLDSEFDEFKNGPCTIYQTAAIGLDCQQDLSDERGPNAPEWTGALFSRYVHNLTSNLLVRFDMDAAYKDDYFLDGDLDSNTLQDSYYKINARLGLAAADDKWEVAVYARNLTDETTYTYATDAPLSAGIYGGWVEEPRIIGLQARYTF
jgi:outer membrane receptor protein involved in Fe transport